MNERIRRWVVLLIVCSGGWLVWGVLRAYSTESLAAPDEVEGSPAERTDLNPLRSPGEETEAAGTRETQTGQIIHTPPPPHWLERIDSSFKTAVGVIERLLFHRLGRTQQDFVIYERIEHYVRERGDHRPFLRHDPAGIYPLDRIDEEQVQLLAARGELLPGDEVGDRLQPYRLGTLNGRAIEFLSVKIPYQSREGASASRLVHGDKLVRVQAGGRVEFRRETKPRGLLSDTDVFAETEVAQLGKLGFLQVPATADGESAWLQTEHVGGIPIVVLWLALGGLFFTIYMRGYNFWGFGHAVNIVRGKYDNPEDKGEVSHFQALSSALSGTVGLGNIAGVTIAMTNGGPGAFLWMLICGFFGMSMKFTECTLGVKYRLIHEDGTVHGGPMRYLKEGFRGTALAPLGYLLAFLFTVLCILASFGGGNMLQANQAGRAMQQMIQQKDADRISELNRQIAEVAMRGDVATIASLQQQKSHLEHRVEQFGRWFRPTYGLILAGLVGIVIIGGIKRIGMAAEKIVPTMCLLYVSCCLYIILGHLSQIPSLILVIFREALTGEAVRGGILGVLVIGMQRAAFSNEAGAGSAAIAHSAARTEEPIREGSVALLEPFIDTIVVCSMTAMAILITGAWNHPDWVVNQGLEGSALTSRAFQEQVQWFPILLSISVSLFAYSTIISWSYYGAQSWEELFGEKSTFIYKILSVVCVFVGTVVHLGAVLDFSDMMILGMAFPNILGVVLLAPRVRKDLLDYWRRHQAGEFRTFH